MAGIEVKVVHQTPLERQWKIPAVCCRNWDLAFGFRPGRCGLCGQVPVAIGSPYL